MTDAERKLWSLLRSRHFEGHKFRRQFPIGSYVADFACLEAKLIVEADGGQHGRPADATRTRWLASQGFRVLRFWNDDVLGNPDGVLTTLLEVLPASHAFPVEAGRIDIPEEIGR